MILHFPNLDAVKLALTSGTVPTSVTLASALAAIGDDGQVWIDTQATLTQAAKSSLKKLGVGLPKSVRHSLDLTLDLWPQLFPLEREDEVGTVSEQTPVLFALPAEGLSALVNEILRLGNDRQSYRFLATKSDGDRVLLRVVGPPYYSLLRALDALPLGRDGQGSPPVAFVEASGSKRLWVQIGYRHPLALQIKVPEKQLLFLQPPRQWTALADEPFRDIYDVLELHVPEAPAAWRDKAPDRRLAVNLRLERGDGTEAAELWVLRGGPGKDGPVEQVDQFVASSEEDLVRQFSFAVAEREGETIVVLRARPGQASGPPVLVLKGAVPFRAHLMEPNLFVPVGTHLHPKLRRATIRELLAPDAAVITWLHPIDPAHVAGAFRPESLPDTAFRPLSDWIDYVLAHEQQALQDWVKATQFDFEPFVCTEEGPDKAKKPPADKEKSSGRRKSSTLEQPAELPPEPTPATSTDAAFVAPLDLRRMAAEPKERERLLRELEKQFLGLEGPLDYRERLRLWPELAALNASLGHAEEAGLCWANALWFDPPDAEARARKWFEAEAARVPLREQQQKRAWSWPAQAVQANAGEVSAADLDRLLALDDVTPADVRALAAYLAWNGLRHKSSVDLVARLVSIRHLLETQEREVPARAMWLAWVGLTRMSGGDVLGLARARDRLLERLFEQGLRAEQDLPEFLRFSGVSSSERFREFRDWLLGLPDTAQLWMAGQTHVSMYYSTELQGTEGYSDLIFAFGLARLGEVGACRMLLDRAAAVLAGRDDVHTVLLGAFTYRIEQVLAGKPHRGPLPQEYLEYLKQLPYGANYRVDRLRMCSSILEPVQEVNAFGHTMRQGSALLTALGELAQMHDPVQVPQVIGHLLHQYGKGPAAAVARAVILREALNVAPRVGEEFAVQMMTQATAAFDQLGDPVDINMLEQIHGQLLGRALFVAGHFDRPELFQEFLQRFQHLLKWWPGPEGLQALENVVRQSLRGLRKLGLSNEIGLLLRQMTERVLSGLGYERVEDFQTPIDERNMDVVCDRNWLASLRVLLSLAGEWVFFGDARQAEPALNAARTLLLRDPKDELLLNPGKSVAPEKSTVACSYIQAVAQMPSPRVIQRLLDELLAGLQVHDNFLTTTHFKIGQLQVLEALVLSVLTDEAALGSEVKRWLDEDEFSVRRRVHRDVRQATKKESH